jgi:hypothetical protein
MTGHELQRVVQYVTAGTSYSRDVVASVLRTGFDEMAALSMHAESRFSREDLVGYLCQWTVKQTGHPEPMVREILDCAGRWLDDVSRTLAQEDRDESNVPTGDDSEGDDTAF